MIRIKKARRRPRRTRFWLVLLFVTASFALAWHLWSCLYLTPPQFHFLLLKINDQLQKILNNEAVLLHPQDRLRIMEVSTSICFNHGIRLYSPEIDVNALLHDTLSFSDLKPDRDIFDKYTFHVQMNRFNNVIGHVEMVIEPYVEDWLDKADRTIDASKRIEILERAFKLLPDHEQIKNRLIETYKAQKQWPQAAALLEKVLQEKTSRENLFSLLEVYEAMSHTEGVISVLKRLIDQDPENMDLRIRLAAALERSKRPDEAIKVYEQLLQPREKEDRLSILKSLGYLYVETGQLDKAIDRYLRAVEMDPEDVNLLYNLSNLYEKIGNRERADFFLKKAVTKKAGDMEGRLKLANGLLQKGDIKEAEAFLSDVLSQNPNSLEALVLMSRIAEKKGDKETLKTLYRKMLSFDPENENLTYNLGILEYETGNLRGSIPYLEKFSKLHPEDKELHTLLFDIYRKLQKEDLAFKEAEILIRMKPEDINPYHFLFDYLNKTKNYEALLSIMRNGIEHHPKEPDLRRYLILAYLETGHEDLAMGELREVLELRPKDMALLLQLGTLQEKQGKLQDALDTYERLLKISSDHQEGRKSYLRLLLSMARSQEKEGNLEEALKTYRKILDFFPGHEEAQEAYLRLRLMGLGRGKKD